MAKFSVGTAAPSTVTGHFEHGKLVGEGSILTTRGMRLDGVFVDGQLDGHVRISFNDGSSMDTLWRSGRFVTEVFPHGDLVAPDIPFVGADEHGLRIPVTINGKITRDFVVDSGADFPLIPFETFEELRKTGTLDDSDILSGGSMTTASGVTIPSFAFHLRSVRIGAVEIRNAIGVVGPPKSQLLLGRSILNRFKTWSIDNDRHVLHLG